MSPVSYPYAVIENKTPTQRIVRLTASGRALLGQGVETVRLARKGRTLSIAPAARGVADTQTFMAHGSLSVPGLLSGIPNGKYMVGVSGGKLVIDFDWTIEEDFV